MDTSGSKTVKVGAVIAALALTGLLLGGYALLQKYQRGRLLHNQASKAPTEKTPPLAQVFQDEVRLKGGQALVTGTVKNISETRLTGLTVEIELKRRFSQETVTRPVPVEPSELNPADNGKYSLQIPPGDWSGVRVSKLRGGGGVELAFKSELGERRPAEPPPSTGKTIIVPRPRRKGDDFLNTPDTPIKIP